MPNKDYAPPDHTQALGEQGSVPTERHKKETKPINNTNVKTGARDCKRGRLWDEVRTYIQHKWQSVNRIDFCPWDSREERALARLFDRSPKLTLEQVKICVDHYFESIRNPSEAPYKWVPQLLDYLATPLDEFNRPLYLTGERLRRSADASKR